MTAARPDSDFAPRLPGLTRPASTWHALRDWTRTPAGSRLVRHGLWLVGLLYASVYLAGAVVGDLGGDAHAYWAAWRHGLYSVGPAQHDAYLYSPAFADAIWPLTRLPWPAFIAVWTVGLTAVFAWLVAPLGRRWALPLMLVLVPEIVFGNVNALFALVLVVGVRYPTAWVFPLLTKVTPAVGIAWFALRRDWRSLVSVLAAVLVVVGISAAVALHLWVEWMRFLIHNSGFLDSGNYYGGETVVIPAVLRLPVAGALTLVAARRSSYATLAPAMVLASPVLSLNTLAILAALPRLRPGVSETAEQAVAAVS